MQLTQGYIYIKDMHFWSHHGVMPQERTVGCEYTVTLRIYCPLEKAMASDDVAHTVNYAEVYDTVKAQMSTPSNLLEHAAARIAQALFSRFSTITSISIDLRKTNPPMGACCDGAGVMLSFQR